MILILMVEGARTLTSVRTCTPTPSCPVAPPCTPVLLTECRRRSPPWLPPPLRSRSSLLPRGSTPSGSAAPSWLPSPPSRRCGSPSRSSMRLVPALSTASASKKRYFLHLSLVLTFFFQPFFPFVCFFYPLSSRMMFVTLILVRLSSDFFLHKKIKKFFFPIF